MLHHVAAGAIAGLLSCTPSAADEKWIADGLSAWARAATEVLEVREPSRPWMVLFDRACAFHVNADEGVLPKGAVPIVLASSPEVPVFALRHDPGVWLPSGNRIDPGEAAFASLSADGVMPFLALALPAIWRTNPEMKDLDVDRFFRGVMMHELVHTRQLAAVARRVEALAACAGLDGLLDDDVVEKRFADVDGFRAAYERERALLYRAERESDDAHARTLTRDALRQLRGRRARYFTGAHAVFAEIEDLFLSMEGVAVWLHETVAARDERVMFEREGNASWSQEEGLALFRLIDRFVPGWKPLLAGATASPVALLERAVATPAPALSASTRAVLERALGEPGDDQMRALAELPEQPDWQAAVDLVVDEIRAAPDGAHNDRLLLIEFAARRRLAEIRIDVAPLIAALETRSWTNQQKGAQALAALSHRADLFAGRERDAARALIPLTTSQRGRVVDAALAALGRVTGQTIGRDPAAWAMWFERAHGERVDIASAPYEVLAVIRRRATTPGGIEFSLNGADWTDAGSLVASFRNLEALAAARALPISTVVVVPVIAFDEATILQQVEPLRPLFRVMQPEELTFSPPSDTFYPPWRPVQDPKTLAGIWKGTARVGDQSAEVAFELKALSDGVGLFMTLPRLHSFAMPVDYVRGLPGGGFGIPGWHITLARDGDTLTGELGDPRVRFTLTKADALPSETPLPSYAPGPAPDWTYDAGAPLWAALAAHEGVIYAADARGAVHAVRASDGTRVWRADFGTPMYGAPRVAADAIFVKDDAGVVRRIERATGREIWRAEIGAAPAARVLPEHNVFTFDFHAPEPLVDGGRVFVSASTGAVHALDAGTGAVVWRTDVGGGIRASVAADGTRVYAGTLDNHVVALDRATGKEIWRYKATGMVTAAPVVTGDLVIASNRGAWITALDAATGKEAWVRYDWFSWIESTGVMANGLFYVGSSDLRSVRAIDPRTGRASWETDVLGWAWGTPALTRDTVYIGVAGPREYVTKHQAGLVAIDRQTGAVRWRRPIAPRADGFVSGYPGSVVIAGNVLAAPNVAGTIEGYRIVEARR